MTVRITNIQRFSLHDGPGIRTTVFLKGCSLHCPWCSNPENIIYNYQKYKKNGNEGIFGKDISCEDLMCEISKDKIFYDNGGGVTFSGGEMLLQQNELVPLFRELKKEKINIAAETSLFYSDISVALKYIDLFLVDIKILNKNNCEVFEGGNIGEYMHNIETLFMNNKNIIFRVPVINGYTDSLENQNEVIKFLKKYAETKNILKIELIKEHNLGISKYESLHAIDQSIKVPNYLGITDEFMYDYKRKIINAIGNSIEIDICKI
jgi:pyruvate formate lyase activating enzyme